MTPDQHAKRAEELLATADGYRPAQGHYHGLVARAQVHATLSLRTPARKEPAPTRAKKTTTTKKKEGET